MNNQLVPFNPASIRLSAIPEQLRNINGWVGSKHLNGKKPPCDISGDIKALAEIGGYPIKEIYEAATNPKNRMAGIGFNCRKLPAGWHFGDFDDCRDPVSGDLSEIAETLVMSLDTYCEASISGTGIRWIGIGPGLTQTKYIIGECSLEVYTPNHDQYVTLTGHQITGPEVKNCGDQLQKFIENHATGNRKEPAEILADQPTATTKNNTPATTPINDPVALARQNPAAIWPKDTATAEKFAALDRGDTIHNTPSQSDFAYLKMLAWLTAKNAEAMRAAFESSGRLNEQSTADRWKRRGDTEIARAISTTDEVFTPPKQPKTKSVKPAMPDFQGMASADADWFATLLTGQSGIKSCISNIATILENDLEWAGVIGYNRFTGKIDKLKPPPYRHSETGEWSDFDDTSAAVWLSKKYSFAAATQHVGEAVNTVSRDNTFHPVQDYLNSLQWDGIQRIDHWLTDYLGAIADDDRYPQTIGRCYLISAVARIMRPGVKVDTMLILEGEQGLRKSTAMKTLAVKDDWFTDADLDIKNKDSYLLIRGKWIVEMAELDALNRAETETLKAFLTRHVDRYREPYGKRMIDTPRQCVFVGTGNKTEYLKDTTGARRFWPIMCTEIDLDGLLEARDQLWAEAVHRFKQGETWWFDARTDFITAEQDKRFDADVWEDMIAEWLESRDEATTTEILGECLRIEAGNQNKVHQLRVAGIMKRLEVYGWSKVKFKTGPKRDKNGYSKI